MASPIAFLALGADRIIAGAAGHLASAMCNGRAALATDALSICRGPSLLAVIFCCSVITRSAAVATATFKDVSLFALVAIGVFGAGAMRVGCFTMGDRAACGALLTVVTLFASRTNGVGLARTAGDLFAMGDGVAAGNACKVVIFSERCVISNVAALALASRIASFAVGADRIVQAGACYGAFTMPDGHARLAQWPVSIGEIESLKDELVCNIVVTCKTAVATAVLEQETLSALFAVLVVSVRTARMVQFTMGNLVAFRALRTVVTLFASCTNRVGRARTAGDRFAMGNRVAARGAYEGGSGRVRRVISNTAALALASGIAFLTGGALRIFFGAAGHFAFAMIDGRAGRA